MDARTAKEAGMADGRRDGPAEQQDAADARQDAAAEQRDAAAERRDGPASRRDGPIADAPVTSDGPAQDTRHLADGATDMTDARPNVDGGSVSSGPGPETSKCAAGRVRVHVRDIWSTGVSPSLGIMTAPPAAILFNVVLDTYDQETFGARLDSAVDVAGGACAYYSACIPNTTIKVSLQPAVPTGCANGSYSHSIDISAVNRKEIWIEYTGASSTLATDYPQTTVPVGPGHFQVTTDSSKLVAPACKIGTPPRQPPVANTIRVHFRWPWTDPVKTGYPGAACGDDGLGYSPPPYPTSLTVSGPNCSLQALLEYQNDNCTWYSALIPKNSILTSADQQIWFQYPVYLVGLRTNTITLPTFSNPANEYWVAFNGFSGIADASTAAICGGLKSSNLYTVTTQNPGPAYPGCGGGG